MSKRPDYPDIDGDGDRKEPMAKAAKDKKKKKGMSKGGAMMKKKGYAMGGASMKKKGMAKGGANMKKKAYAKGGRVAMYNVGGMVKSSGPMNTGIARPKNTYKKG
jgi:hypothetical protein|tara:strand:- start:860 stop:1174 length:315 start_codon:yes stop_codon:yes gene_type:complete